MQITGGLNCMAKRYNLRPHPSYKKVGCCGPYCLPESERYKRHPCPSYWKKKRSFTPYIAPEIIFNILVFLPADVLYNVMRYVCREWYNIISSSTFIDAHLQKAERGILIKQNWPDCSLQFVQMVKHDCPKLSKVHLSGFSNYISPSYNGLALFSKMELGNRFVANLVTKKVVALPPPSAASGANPTLSYIGCTTKKKYKLVEFYYTRLRTFEGAILTLGVDKEWRCIFEMNDTWRFKEFGASIFIFKKPIATGGFLHWTHNMLPLILNLDLETETLCMCTVPECAEMKHRRYLGTGSTLRIMDRLGKFLWGLWVLKDAETGEWTKLASLDLRPQEQMLRSSLCPPGFQLLPVGWLKDGQIAILCVEYEDGIERQVGYHEQTHPTRTCIAYNFATGAVNSFQLRKGRPDDMHQSTKCIPYVKSLVSPRFAAT